MKPLLRIFAFLLAFALLGAPVGMARMMGGHELAAAPHQHHQQHKSPQHMRFMVCAACVGVTAPPALLPDLTLPAEALAYAETPALDGISAIPLLPPPRI